MKKNLTAQTMSQQSSKVRQQSGGQYYYITTTVTGDRFQIDEAYDYGHDRENKHYSIGNYFLTKERAQATVTKLMEVLRNA